MASKLSIDKIKGHLSRSQASRDKKWERGTPFANGPVLRYAKLAVMAEIEKRSEKNTCRAEAILFGVVSDLMREGLEDCAVLSKATQEDVCAFIY